MLSGGWTWQGFCRDLNPWNGLSSGLSPWCDSLTFLPLCDHEWDWHLIGLWLTRCVTVVSSVARTIHTLNVCMYVWINNNSITLLLCSTLSAPIMLYRCRVSMTLVSYIITKYCIVLLYCTPCTTQPNEAKPCLYFCSNSHPLKTHMYIPTTASRLICHYSCCHKLIIYKI